MSWVWAAAAAIPNSASTITRNKELIDRKYMNPLDLYYLTTTHERRDAMPHMRCMGRRFWFRLINFTGIFVSGNKLSVFPVHVRAPPFVNLQSWQNAFTLRMSLRISRRPHVSNSPAICHLILRLSDARR